MRFRPVLIGVAAAGALILSACYNNPNTSLKHPGDGPAHMMSGPAVGPGTTAGGSTAGPQPKSEEHGGGHVQAEHGQASEGSAQPQAQPGAQTPAAPAGHSEGKH